MQSHWTSRGYSWDVFLRFLTSGSSWIRYVLLLAMTGLSHSAPAAESPKGMHILPLPETTIAQPTRWKELSPSPVTPPPGPARSGCPKISAEDPDLPTIDRVSGEQAGPRIAEPMVFDLIRPLGAKRGEQEANVLGLVPLSSKSRRVDGVPDPLGLVRRSRDREGLEWAPEIEWAICDGMGLELELPMENARLEAYKVAGQVTLGTAFDHRFIHGTQAIVQYGRHPALWTTTLLYLAGFRFDETWSIFGMFGGRAEVSGRVPNRQVELLMNMTLFADVTDRVVAGIETNLGQSLGGSTEFLAMPQLHYEIDRYWMIQVGVGARFTTAFTLPEAGFRLIREF